MVQFSLLLKQNFEVRFKEVLVASGSESMMGLGGGMETVVITGGLGYIGSHLIESLIETDTKIIVLDKADFLKYGELPDKVSLFKMNLSDSRSAGHMSRIFKDLPSSSTVIHLAAEKSVEESTRNPALYQRENVLGTKNLLTAMSEGGLNRLIFASTAAVYGDPSGFKSFNESQQLCPLSPYAQTKVLSEKLILDSNIQNLHFAILRFFNVAGASKASLIERDGKNLIPILLSKHEEAKSFIIFGNDYSTIDGTCVRDYVDVRDLVLSINLCIKKLTDVNLGIINIGNGTGYSVLQVVNAFREKVGDFPYDFGPRRLGDPARVVSDIHRAKTVLGWEPKYSLADMVASVISNTN